MAARECSDLGHEIAVADRARVLGAAVDRAGEPGAGVGERADGGGRDTGGLGLLEHGAPRLPDVRVGVVAPQDVVEGAVLPRDVGDEAEDAVAARRQAGAERGEADRGGAGAGRRQVADRPGEPGEGRREVGVRAQQVGAEAVDEQDAPPGGGRRGRWRGRAGRPAGRPRSTGTPSAAAAPGRTSARVATP